jgi:hypothetical protein
VSLNCTETRLGVVVPLTEGANDEDGGGNDDAKLGAKDELKLVVFDELEFPKIVLLMLGDSASKMILEFTVSLYEDGGVG